MEKEKLDNFTKEAGEKINEISKMTAEMAKEIGTKMSTKAQELAISAKNTIEAEKIDYQIAKKYKEIGKLIYSAYDQGVSYDKMADDICEEITGMFDQIIALKTGDLMDCATGMDVDEE